MELINLLTTSFWISNSNLIIVLTIIYISPIFIQFFYRGFTRGLTIATIFLWRTPIPRVILTLNIIELNKGTDNINDWIDEIIKNQEEIIKKLNLNLIVNKKNQHSQEEN